MPFTGHIKRTSRNGGVEGLKKRTNPAMVKVGVLRGAGEHNNSDTGATVAEIAWWQEFGTKRVKAKHFLRSTLINNDKKYRDLMKRLIRNLLLAKIKPEKAQGALGLLVQRDIQATITAIHLIDTGQLRQSISWAGWTG